MKVLFDFFPILVFFIVFKFYGIYVATAVFLIASTIQIAAFWFHNRRFEPIHWITFIVGLVLGGATLLFHNELFIKWKPSVIYWILGCAFLLSHVIGKRTLIQRMMEHNLTLEETVWKRLSYMWVVFFMILGFLNIYVAYHYNTNTWVNFKLFGLLGLTLIFAILQGVYIGRHLNIENKSL